MIIPQQNYLNLVSNMAWKNIQQKTLVGAMLIEHDALKELNVVHE